MPLITRIAAVVGLALLSGPPASVTAPDAGLPNDRRRVVSTLGFSFLPPQGPSWSEQFETHQITYLKQTDPSLASFYAGAVEGRLRSSLTTKDELVAFVRSKKDQWGDGDRYSSISTSFQVEEKNDSCVRYRLSAHDRDAKNKGKREFLAMQAVGRFCTHPQNKRAAVDVFYSVRHVPSFDPKDLISEGETFLQGLEFEKAR